MSKYGQNMKKKKIVIVYEKYGKNYAHCEKDINTYMFTYWSTRIHNTCINTNLENDLVWIELNLGNSKLLNYYKT